MYFQGRTHLITWLLPTFCLLMHATLQASEVTASAPPTARTRADLAAASGKTAPVQVDLGFRTLADHGVELSAGIKVDSEPVQLPLQKIKKIRLNSYQLELVDVFQIRGLVLSKRTYLSDERADIAPLDLVLGWRSMSDPNVLSQIGIRQNQRFYFWHVEEFPIPRREIERNSTNLHIIPANPEIAEKMRLIRIGQTVKLQGHLVDVQAKDGFRWISSRSREDTGDGACEILLLEALDIRASD